MTLTTDRNEIKKSRTWIEIDTRALRKNVETIRKISGCRKMMVAVKADAYGHGAVEVASVLSDVSEMFAVAAPCEALELRRAGIENDILILSGASPCAIPEILENGVIPTMFDVDSARVISEEAEKLGIKADVFIAVDTGMSRIGVSSDEKGAAITAEISSLKNIRIKGIFTHLARADEEDKSTTLAQLSAFARFTSLLDGLGVEYGETSISNSAAALTMNIPQDIVRGGIAVYGIAPSDEVPLPDEIKPVMSMRSRIEQIKKVPAGTGVSYGHTFVTKRPTKLATVYCGYADGYPRALSGKGRVLVRAQYAPIVGRICMDQFMVDVTDTEGVEKDDVVTLFGKDGDNEIGVGEIAKLSGTITYEILAGFSSPRVPKIYL
ncbi:MAG: alanine racemase [Clostridia bacterium]|nr:alanine racemase [Clostridia bacterium]